MDGGVNQIFRIFMRVLSMDNNMIPLETLELFHKKTLS
jgi:hypothetical protein